MSLVYSSWVGGALFWATVFGFVLLDGRLVARALAGRATSERSELAQGLAHRPVGLIWISVAEGAGFAAAALDPFVVPWRWPMLAVGLVAAWFGLGLRFWAKRVLGRFFVGAVVIQHEHRVVTDGPYAAIRHPGYAGMIVALFGLGVATGNVLSIVLLGGVPLLVILRTIGIEEDALVAALGDQYVAYQRRTARLAPGVW